MLKKHPRRELKIFLRHTDDAKPLNDDKKPEKFFTVNPTNMKTAMSANVQHANEFTGRN